MKNKIILMFITIVLSGCFTSEDIDDYMLSNHLEKSLKERIKIDNFEKSWVKKNLKIENYKLIRMISDGILLKTYDDTYLFCFEDDRSVYLARKMSVNGGNGRYNDCLSYFESFNERSIQSHLDLYIVNNEIYGIKNYKKLFKFNEVKKELEGILSSINKEYLRINKEILENEKTWIMEN